MNTQDKFDGVTNIRGDLIREASKPLKERRPKRRWLWATVLAVALLALVCAYAFVKTVETPEDRPLTQHELHYFNNEVFNGDSFNIRNQFLFFAVKAPEGYKRINLFELFYNGSGEADSISEEERQAVVDTFWLGEDPGVNLYKYTADKIDEILREYLGLTFEETNKWGLDMFMYLEKYDAYYTFSHVDTNYPGEVNFTAGEWKDGKILLYYQGENYPKLVGRRSVSGAWAGSPVVCLTLEEQEDGSYHFLSNWECDLPVPTVHPISDPELVISLDGLEPYESLPSMEPDTVPANSSFDRTERDFTDTSNVHLLYKKEAFTQEDLNDNFLNYATGESRISLPKTYLDGAVETANVVGIVLDHQEKTPIEGATVAANGDVLVSTDCNGRFQIVNMPDGKYTWTVTASDYFDAQYKNYFVDHFEGANIYTFYIDDEKSIMKDRDLVHTGVQTVPPREYRGNA